VCPLAHHRPRDAEEPKTTTEPSLHDLRQRIDRIDEQMHELLMARAALVRDIRSRKDRTGSPAIQPLREAEILRRLASRHRGDFPFGSVARIWREIISGLTHLQSPLTVTVFAPPDQPGSWDLARDHFGSTVPMTAHGSAGQVIRSVNERSAVIGVLPMPLDGEEDPWWPQLLTRSSAAPRVIARLPFAGRGNGRGSGDALAIATGIGDFATVERCLVAIEIPSPVSRARLNTCFKAAGLDCDLVLVALSQGRSLALIDAAGPAPAADERMARLSAELGEPIDRVFHLGGYAEPLPPAA
jgi:chorismate mutase